MRLKAFFILGFALLSLIGLTSASAGAEVSIQDTSCPTFNLCIWGQPNYGGAKTIVSSSTEGIGIVFNATIRSAKKHFSNRAVWFFNVDTGAIARCLNPNTDRPGPFPDRTRALLVGFLGSRC